MSKTIVVHHSADFDGIFCREIAKKFLPEAELIGWDFGDPPLQIPDSGSIYVMDLPLDAPFGGRPGEFNLGVISAIDSNRLIWIDHHKSAIESHPTEIGGYRIDGVAACRLAWMWFYGGRHELRPEQIAHLPKKEDFVKRVLNEPVAVILAGEYDIWDKRDPRAELFQHGLRSMELTDEIWKAMLQVSMSEAANCVEMLLQDGRAVQFARKKENESIIRNCGFTIQFEGFTFLACNAARYNSQLFEAGLKPEHDGCFGFNWDGKQWRVSLYSDKPGIDLSPIAAKYGGGGHRGACGFRVSKLPFLP